tara:strand:+ start:7244 stop:7564 length:321 start_codon:yes stop_codon:yes gene_type:complete
MTTLTLGNETISIIDDVVEDGSKLFTDMVNSPPHYNKSGIECIDAIRAATDVGYKYYLQGTVIKYLWRYEYKNKPIEDLKKARWYLNKLIDATQKNEHHDLAESFT